MQTGDISSRPDRDATRTARNVLGAIAIDPLRIAWALASCALTVLVLWLLIVDEPLGGEPVAVLPLPPVGDAEMQAAADDLGIRETLNPEDNADYVPPPEPAMSPEMAEVDTGPDPLDEQFDAMAAAGVGGPATSLVTAPIDGLTEQSPHGLLPRISISGDTPAKLYARPLTPTQAAATGPKIAIMIGGMGLSAQATSVAINTLPESVTLAFAPYGRNITDWAHKARQNGHEVMLQLPMEPYDYPENDPGPHTLLTSPAENMRRLQWLMARFPGYFGVTNYMGARFTSTPDAVRPVLSDINQRGLVYVEDGSSARSQAVHVARQIGIKSTGADLIIDAVPSADGIDAALKQLEAIARDRGVALGAGSGLPITVEAIIRWARTLEDKGIHLVPVSATIELRQNLS